eukprot:scaffold12475_cov63-Isochrysis_galbana.AAC.3
MASDALQSAVVPQSDRKLRACMVTGLVKTEEQVPPTRRRLRALVSRAAPAGRFSRAQRRPQRQLHPAPVRCSGSATATTMCRRSIRRTNASSCSRSPRPTLMEWCAAHAPAARAWRRAGRPVACARLGPRHRPAA